MSIFKKFLDESGVKRLVSQMIDKSTLQTVVEVIDQTKANIEEPDFIGEMMVYRNPNNETASILMTEEYEDEPNVSALYLGMDGPATLTEEEMRELEWSEEEIAFFKRVYGDTTKPAIGILTLFDGQGGMNIIQPNQEADYATYTLPYQSGTLVTAEELIELFESEYFADIITNALDTWSGGDY